MRIAFYSYPAAFQNPGGGEVQLLKTKEYLEKLGVEVKFFDQWNDKFEDFDILHVFGSVKDCVGLMQTARNKGVKVALSSIFWSSFKRALNEGGSSKKKTELFLRHLMKLLIPVLPTGRRKTMVLSDIIFPNGESEKKQLIRLFGIESGKIKPVPNGIDERFLDAIPDEFVLEHGLKDFVLAVGRIEPRKNQLNLIKALKETDRKLVIVGDPVSEYKNYYEECKKNSGENVIFLGGIDHEEELLSSAYAACSVFVAPGWFETPGLAALEAAAAKASIAITKYGCTEEYFQGEVSYFDPSNITQIKHAVLEADSRTDEDKNILKQRISEKYTWNNVAKETLSGYEEVVGKT